MNISRGWVNPTLNSGENKAYFFHFMFKRKFPFEYFPCVVEGGGVNHQLLENL